MAGISLQLTENRTAYAPREKLSGKVTWELAKAPTSGELRLIWRTHGRGTADYGVAETIPITETGATGAQSFAISLPEGPYSFSGTLITLTWTLEVEFLPGKNSERLELIIAPARKAISLPAVTSKAP
jgi:hypothetical protein